MSNYSSEKIVKAIKRKTRRKYSSEEKIRIVLDGQSCTPKFRQVA